MLLSRFKTTELAARLRGHLIVSCQALPNEPLHGSEVMARMAQAAEQGGAVAIRANTPADIAAIRRVTDLPIIGLWKVDVPGYDVYITPRVEHAQAIADAGADIIALDATARPHPEGTIPEFIGAVREATGLPVLADIATEAEGIAAAEAGAEFVSTTMSGYTPESPKQEGPDLELVQRLARRLHVPVFAEGRINTPENAAQAMALGAWAVIVGGAITRPKQIAERFNRAIVAATGRSL